MVLVAELAMGRSVDGCSHYNRKRAYWFRRQLAQIVERTEVIEVVHIVEAPLNLELIEIAIEAIDLRVVVDAAAGFAQLVIEAKALGNAAAHILRSCRLRLRNAECLGLGAHQKNGQAGEDDGFVHLDLPAYSPVKYGDDWSVVPEQSGSNTVIEPEMVGVTRIELVTLRV